MDDTTYETHLQSVLEDARREAEDTAEEAVSLLIVPGVTLTVVIIRIGLETYQTSIQGRGKTAVKQICKGIIDAARDYAGS